MADRKGLEARQRPELPHAATESDVDRAPTTPSRPMAVQSEPGSRGADEPSVPQVLAPRG